MNIRAVLILLASMPFGLSVSLAHEKDQGLAVVPQAERDLAAQKNMAGPTKTVGIKTITSKAEVPLGSEFPSTEGRQLRAREILMEPGGVVAIHQHNQRPGVAYILEGEIYEHRDGVPQPLLRKQGDVAVEQTGVTHWWENKSNKPVRALVVDIVPIEMQKP